MSEVLLDDLTLFVRETYHSISPQMYPAPTFEPGRALNLPEEAEDGEMAASPDGHKIVCVNEVFEDGQGTSLRVIDVLGNGTFSYVFKCQLIKDPRKFVALKIIRNLRQYRQTGISEILIHQKMAAAPEHPGKHHVIMPITSFEVDEHVCLVMPLYQRSLFEGICQTQPLLSLLGSVRRVMKQLLQALEFIHRAGIMHCDLKPDNILFSNDDCDDIVLIDFGSATTHMEGMGEYIQSRFYRSPEVMLGLPFDSEIDIWSAGCVAAELFLDFAIFACENEFDGIHSMVALLGPMPEKMLGRSPRWQRFFDMKRSGFQPKMDPNEVLMTKHSYHQIYEQIGALPLDQLIQGHMEIKTDEEQKTVTCFTDFVMRLLNFDPTQRLTATQALAHPFLEGNPLPDGWRPPISGRPSQTPGHQAQSATPPAFGVRASLSSDMSKTDFLALM